MLSDTRPPWILYSYCTLTAAVSGQRKEHPSAVIDEGASCVIEPPPDPHPPPSPPIDPSWSNPLVGRKWRHLLRDGVVEMIAPRPAALSHIRNQSFTSSVKGCLAACPLSL